MRQIGTLEQPAQAKQFAAYLVTQGVMAHAEPDGGKWAVWVRDENQVERAKDELIRFRSDPAAAEYQSAVREAEAVQRKEQQKREKARKNLVEMRGRWGRGTARRAPVVFILIAISVAVALATNLGRDPRGAMQYLLFQSTFTAASPAQPAVVPQQILGGQVWRLVTPIFLHFGVMHIVFNMYWLFLLGTQVEHRIGSLRFTLLVLGMAVMSNFGQYLWQVYGEQSYGAFGGMSGVDYGLFGYVWIKTLYFPSQAYRLSPFTAFLMFAFFFACILREIPATAEMMAAIIPSNIANMAHAVGLLVGVAAAYAPLLFKPGHRD